MCVAITLEPGADLSLDEITKMDRANADGFGMAWVYEGAVHWWKTIKVNPEEVKDRLTLWADTPRLAHFRLATAGGTKAELCHPFDISPQSICTPEGSGRRVMIHNGHWNKWTEVLRLLDDEGLLPDKGPWSDSRLAAFLSHVDSDWLQALGGRVATLDTDGDIIRLGDWQELRTGLYVSNKYWETATTRRGGYSGYHSWKGWGEDKDSEYVECGVTPPNGTRHSQTNLSWSNTHQRTHKEEPSAKNKAQRKQGKEERARQYSGAHWQQESTGRWFVYDQTARAVVDVTHLHQDGASGEDGTSGKTEGGSRGEGVQGNGVVEPDGHGSVP